MLKNPLVPIAALILAFSPMLLQAQERHEYEISILGISIGDMVATKETKSDTTYFLLRSEVSFWFFGRINLDYTTEVKYHQGQFIESSVEKKTNRGNFLSRIWLEDGVYEIRANSYKYEFNDQVSEKIDYSAVRLFFEEPKGKKRMITENHGQFASISSKGNGAYDTYVEGNENNYQYENGKLQEVSMHSPIKNYVIQRKE
ncbi:DUF6134 family protein [Cyclobacterium plantarum]|uniref:DUF6134 family protein n=1 Tax=Cyclobacterium plantarum TaxID=2716263 RepID=UPI003F71B23A